MIMHPAPPRSAEERLRWLQDRLLDNPILWRLFCTMVGANHASFAVTGDTTLGEVFDSFIDRRISGLPG